MRQVPQLIHIASHLSQRKAFLCFFFALSSFIVQERFSHAREERLGSPTFWSHLDSIVGQPQGLLPDTVAMRAVDTSFFVKQRAETLAGAEAGLSQAVIGYVPRLTQVASYTRLSTIENAPIGNVVMAPTAPPGPLAPDTPQWAIPLAFASPNTQKYFQTSVLIPLLDYVLRLPKTHTAARRNRDAARWSERASRLQVATEGRVVYFSWAQAKLQTVVAQQSLVQAQQHCQSVRHLLDAGAASKADVMRIEAQLASSQLMVARAKEMEAVLAEQLSTLMHDPPGTTYEIGENLREEVPEAPNLANTDALFSEAWSKRLEIRALDETIRALEAQAQATRASYLPRIDGVAELVYAEPNTRYLPPPSDLKRTWAAGLQLSWTLNDTASGLYAVDAAFARMREIEAQRGVIRDALRMEVIQSVEALRAADIARQSTAHGLEAAEESYRARRDLFENGRATSVELTDAETGLTQARINAVGARIGQRIARVRFVHATGRDIEPLSEQLASDRRQP